MSLRFIQFEKFSINYIRRNIIPECEKPKNFDLFAPFLKLDIRIMSELNFGPFVPYDTVSDKVFPIETDTANTQIKTQCIMIT